MKTMRPALAILPVLILGLIFWATPVWSADLKGRVASITGTDIQIILQGNLRPRRGDSVTVTFDAGGVEVDVGEWRVVQVNKDGSVFGRQVQASAPAAIDMSATIHSSQPVAWPPPPQRISRTGKKPKSNSAWAARDKARKIVNKLFVALQADDEVETLRHLTGEVRDALVDDLKKQSLKELLDKSGGRPLSYKMRCTLCNRDQTQCEVLADSRQLDGRDERTATVLFFLRYDRRRTALKIYDIDEPSRSRLKAFMAKKPACFKN